MVKSSAAWHYSVGMLPHRVVAYEDPARKNVLYLRWRMKKGKGSDWVRRSLGFSFTRDKRGRIPKEEEARARAAADKQYARLVGGGSMSPTVIAVSIAEGWEMAIDPERGKWTEDTPHRKEMTRAIERAKSVWGASTAWNAIERGDIRKLWRSELKRVRAKGLSGVRSAEIVVTRVMTLADWLRDEQKIALTACVRWKQMKAEMETDFGEYNISRPRYSLDEYRAILAASWRVDPRWALLLEVGAEYRLGQVVRMMRSHVDLAAGTVRVPGRGKKKGAMVQLTAGQLSRLRSALEKGYLAGLEDAFSGNHVEDYPLFPGMHLPRDSDGNPTTTARHATRSYLGSRALRDWLNKTEELARVDGKPIEHVGGRGWYGLRRVAVDAAKEAKISREGLQAHGGWSDSQVPDIIYAEQEQVYAREEAAAVRAQIRGEIHAETEQNGAKTETAPTGAAANKKGK